MPLNPDFLSELRKYFRGEIRDDTASRVLYATDASIYQIEPLGVALPRTQDDLHAVVELAAKYSLPILPRGSGSSLAGQAIGEALILDLSRHLHQIIQINPEARTATVEPGVVLSTLNRAAARHGLQYGPDPASAERATLGGVIGNNATGAHSITYGMTADHLIAADVLFADGALAALGEVSLARAAQIAAGARPGADFSLDVTSLGGPGVPGGSTEREATLYAAALHIRRQYAEAIRAAYPQTWRNSAGYRLNYLLPWSASRPPQWMDADYPPVRPGTLNLAPLLAGSEGTLAVIRRATLNLVARPKHTALAVLSYNSIGAACDDVPRLLAFNPSAVELIPRMLIHLARQVPAYARQIDFVDGDPAALLVVEFSGDAPQTLAARARALGPDLRIVTDGEAQARVWNVRKVGLGLFDAAPTAARPIAFIEDCAIPVEHLGEFVREVERILNGYGTYAAFYAHASAGCLHIRPLIDLRTGQGVRHLREIATAVLALTLRVGGAMSSEHGDGLARSEWLAHTYGESVTGAMRLLKRAADPQSILNPKNLLDAPPMDTHLRFGPDYQARDWQPALDFARQGGLARAIAQCNGQGVCRKDGGVMCPSFQATREEAYSTRGRANLLRAMITLGGQGLAPEQVKTALDLCLACKGCKAECPSGVDMAKLKYEFQHEYYKTHPRPLRDFLFGHINSLAPLPARFGLGGLFNWLGAQVWARRALQAALRISAHRPLPRFGKRENRRTGRQHNARHVEVVLYLPDTFSRYFEPGIERAALDALTACGVQALPLAAPGAGRTLLSKGFIEPARRHAAALLNEIHRLDPHGMLPVVGVEPSEIYTLRDDLRDLLPGRADEIESLAARAWMVDEYLVRPAADGVRRIDRAALPDTPPSNSSVLLHGHCYQKAQPPAADGFPVGQAASAALLRAAGYDVEIISSGCCGMAGAFGYEAEHHTVSMQVGELVLLPAARQAKAQERIVSAVGTSCRSQIADGADVAASHPIQLVAERFYNCP